MKNIHKNSIIHVSLDPAVIFRGLSNQPTWKRIEAEKKKRKKKRKRKKKFRSKQNNRRRAGFRSARSFPRWPRARSRILTSLARRRPRIRDSGSCLEACQESPGPITRVRLLAWSFTRRKPVSLSLGWSNVSWRTCAFPRERERKGENRRLSSRDAIATGKN